MDTTPISLLERIRKPGDEAAWRRFVELATPLLNSWALRLGVQSHDAADLTQEVLAVLFQKLPEFSYDRDQSFRAWMRVIATNKWREWQRKRVPVTLEDGDGRLDELAVRDAAEAFWEFEFRQYLTARALGVMRAEFRPTTWQACWEHVVGNRPAGEVAAELGLSRGAVYMATSRVLKRLREELEGLIE